jgi:hypothetical protein
LLRMSLAPVGSVTENIDAAKNDHNFIAQVFRGVTGISPKDIATYDPRRRKSELRKLANAIAGGKNSEVRKPFG